MLQEKFDKLNLPQDELLDTRVDSSKFEVKVETPDNNMKLNSETLKSTGKQAIDKIKERWDQFKNRSQESKISLPHIKLPSRATPPPPPVEEVTNLKDEIKKESDLKTIEELKDPELASYPILFSKTVEVIHNNDKEDADRDMGQLKEIVEPDVEVPKDLPQSEADPYLPPSSESSNPNSSTASNKKSSWVSKAASSTWTFTRHSVQHLYHTIRDSDVGVQFVVLSVGVGRLRSTSM